MNANDDRDAQAVKDALIAEARSIQKLLVDYQKAQEALQKDVNEFVARDKKEEELGRKLGTRVAMSELEMCNNVDFLKFETRKCKTDCVIPTRRMQEQNKGSSVTSSTKFTMSQICANKSDLPDSAPLSAAQLRDFSDMVEVLLGWRSHDKNFSIETEKLCRVVYNDVSDSSRYVCCFNGFPFVCHSDDANSSANMTQMCETIKQEIATVPFNMIASVAAQVYHNVLMSNSLLTKDELYSVLTRNSKNGTNNTVHVQCIPFLTGDAYDNVVVVEKEKLIDAQLFRGFFFKGELRLIEHIGPEVEMMNLLASSNNSSLANAGQSKESILSAERQRLIQTFREVFSLIAVSNKINSPDTEGRTLSHRNVCMILGVKREQLSSSNDKPQRCVLLDIHPISPNLPFQWKLSWEELCSVGQKDIALSPEVLFKCTTVSVLELNTYDEMSKIYFPQINQLLQR